MEKYGIDKFNIELIEECSDEVVSERERFWIQEFQSFKNGYNATIGGDGKPYIDYDLVCSLYEQLQNQTEVANHMNINRTTVAYILKSRHIPTKSSGEMAKEKSSKPVVCYTKTGELINSFSSMADAARYIKEIKNSTANLSSIITNIGRCVSGKRKTAYDFIWK